MQPIDNTMKKLVFDGQSGKSLQRSSFNTTDPPYTTTQDPEAIEWAGKKIKKEAMEKAGHVKSEQL